MYCIHCGKQLTDDSKFCSYCGRSVEIQKNTDNLADLVGKARAGDKYAVAELYKKTYSQVFYTVKSMIKDEDTVFDILQDTYIKAFAHLDHFEGNVKFLPWVRQIAANTARDWLKKKKPTLFVELKSENGQDIPVEERFVDERSTSMPELVIDQKETARLIRDIIDELPEDQRAVIGMFYYEELSVKQIADAMGATESAVKSRLMYGRKKIEAKVLDLEKKGTKLYGLSPIPFLLLLFRSQKACAGTLPPNGQILQTVLESTAESSAYAARAKAAGTVKNAVSKTGTATSSATGSTAATTGGLGATKIALIVLASAAVIGAGTFAISQLRQENSETTPPKTVQDVPEEKESTPPAEESTPPAEETEEVDPVEKALEQYRNIINQADTYQYDSSGSTTPTGKYRYALVQMHPDDSVPTLLLSQETTDNLYFIRVFQYDPSSDITYQPEESLMEGVAQAGGYRGGLGMMADGNGLCITDISSGTGSMTISRATLDGETLHTSVEWEGSFTDPTPENLDLQEIEWHDITDLSTLDNYVQSKAQPENENKSLLTGYAGTYTPYENFHDLYGGGERLRDITLAESGMITGGETSWSTIDVNGQEPSEIIQNEDGSIEITFSGSTAVYTVYPAGVVPDGYDTDYWQGELDLSKVHIRYLNTDGGVMDVLYHS